MSFLDGLADTWSSTISVGRSLSDPEWDLPTDCPGWTVRDQVSHIIGAEATLLGRPSPPPVTGLPHLLNPIGELNEGWVEARRGLPGSVVLDEMEELTTARLAALRSMTPEELGAETGSPIGRVPYRVFMEVRVMDCWVHEQDIRRAVGRPGGYDGPAADQALGRLISTLGYVIGKRAAPPDETVVRLVLTGPAARTVAFGVAAGRAGPADAAAEATVELTMDGDTFVCLAGGRWTGEQAGDLVSISGDVELGWAIAGNLSTMP